MAPPRIVLYSHDTLGFGHLRRNLLIARALKESRLAPEILLIGGMREAGAFELPAGVDCITLPAYAKGSDGAYRPRDLGGDLAGLTALRSQAIKATVQSFEPDVMLVDNVPRGALNELDPVLKELRKSGRTRLVLGLRDVIDQPAVVRRQWLRQRNFEAVRALYDDVWIYGDPALYDLLGECELAAALDGKGTYVGYLDHSTRLSSVHAAADCDAVVGGDPRPYILCAVGGGRDGAPLCEAFASAALPKGRRGILVTGSQMAPWLRARLKALAARRDDLTVIDFVREPIALMQGAARVVSMGGYNTVGEVLSLRCRALIVPRARPRAEQALRAERLAARGLVSVLRTEDLSADAIGGWLARPVRRPDLRGLDLGGLDRVRLLVEGLLARDGFAAPRLAAAE